MGGGGEAYSFQVLPQSCNHSPSHPYNAWMESVRFSQTRQSTHEPSAKRREVFGDPHEGLEAEGGGVYPPDGVLFLLCPPVYVCAVLGKESTMSDYEMDGCYQQGSGVEQ